MWPYHVTSSRMWQVFNKMLTNCWQNNDNPIFRIVKSLSTLMTNLNLSLRQVFDESHLVIYFVCRPHETSLGPPTNILFIPLPLSKYSIQFSQQTLGIISYTYGFNLRTFKICCYRLVGDESIQWSDRLQLQSRYQTNTTPWYTTQHYIRFHTHQNWEPGTYYFHIG